MELRDYQTKLVDDVRQQIRLGQTRILILLPTGGGKTAIASYIISRTVKRGNRAMMTAHRSEIISQTGKTMKEFNVPYGLIQAGEKMNLKQPMQVASILTLRNRLDKIPVPKILVIDESQHLVSRTWKEVADYYSERGTIILGLSATPKRLSGESLSSCFDVMVQGPSIKELINMGALSKFKYFAPSVGIDTSTIHIKCGDFDKGELEIAVNKKAITGDVIAHYNRLIPGKRAIVFCVSVAHAKSVAGDFNESGIAAEFVEGTMPKEARKSAIQRFRNGETLVLTNIAIAAEGVDIPSVEAVILLRPTMSESLFLQQVGRALRIDPNNMGKVAVVLDHVNNVQRHNLPDAPRQWTLDGTTSRRRDEPSIGVRVCPMCYGCLKPAPVCPYCGYKFEVTRRMLAEEKGELKEFDAELLEIAKRKKRIELNCCKTIADLKQFAEENGYKSGWVYMRARLKNIRS
jgi:superfamily II DNA or RNA helicase